LPGRSWEAEAGVGRVSEDSLELTL
jgi:hypothetical protein